MEIGYHGILKGIVLTSKSTELYKKLGKITFKVHASANKIMIKSAVEKIWNVKVDNVRVVNTIGKRKRFSGKFFKTSGKRKAIVTLLKGYAIDLPEQFELASTSSNAEQSHEQGVK